MKEEEKVVKITKREDEYHALLASFDAGLDELIEDYEELIDPYYIIASLTTANTTFQLRTAVDLEDE